MPKSDRGATAVSLSPTHWISPRVDPLEPALASAAWALRPGGRLALLLTHPCFRIPRQSGWGWDEGFSAGSLSGAASASTARA